MQELNDTAKRILLQTHSDTYNALKRKLNEAERAKRDYERSTTEAVRLLQKLQALDETLDNKPYEVTDHVLQDEGNGEAYHFEIQPTNDMVENLHTMLLEGDIPLGDRPERVIEKLRMKK